MPKVWTGQLRGEHLRIGIVVSRFNQIISDRLLAGAIDALTRHGVQDGSIEVAWVPGAMEIPLAARRLTETGRFQALVCLGAVIRGETPHFEQVCNTATSGIAAVAESSGIPVMHGVLTCEDTEQALARAGGKGGNKGFDAAAGAIEMANLLAQIRP